MTLCTKNILPTKYLGLHWDTPPKTNDNIVDLDETQLFVRQNFLVVNIAFNNGLAPSKIFGNLEKLGDLSLLEHIGALISIDYLS